MSDEVSTRPRLRMAKDERRRQLVGIGLRMLTERPIQEVSLDSVAQEAGISRGLLFHYFPTKTAFYEAVVAAAGRRILRTVTPAPELVGRDALRALLENFVAQIARRHELYSALVQGNLTDLGGAEVAGTLRERLTEIVLSTYVDGRAPAAPVVHAWIAYVEDLAVQGARPAMRATFDADAIVEHALGALDALAATSFAPSPAVPAESTSSSPQPTPARAAKE